MDLVVLLRAVMIKQDRAKEREKVLKNILYIYDL